MKYLNWTHEAIPSIGFAGLADYHSQNTGTGTAGRGVAAMSVIVESPQVNA
jgi:hypothetical protein